MAFRILGLPNLVDSHFIAVTATSQLSSSLGYANLNTPEPSEVWRSLTVNPYDTMLRFKRPAGFGGAASGGYITGYDSMALINHNLTRSGYVRSIAFDDEVDVEAYYAAREVVPTGSAETTNTAGTFASVDEGFAGAADGNTIGPTASGVGWEILLTFPNPATPPSTSAKSIQSFVAEVSMTLVLPPDYTTDNPQWAPSIRAILREGGIARATLATKRVTVAGGQYLIWNWDASLLQGTGTVGVLISCYPAADPTIVADINLKRLSWFVEDDEQLGGTVIDNFDSGWVAATSDIGLDLLRTYDSAPRAPQNYLYTAANYVTSARDAWLLIRDDHAPDALLDIEPVDVAPGYIEAGVGMIGKSFVTSAVSGPTYGPIITTRDLSTKYTTDGGQTGGASRVVLRVVTILLHLLTQEEAMTLMDRLVRRRGRLGPVLVSLNNESTTSERHFGNIYCTLEEAPSLAALNAYYSSGALSARSISPLTLLEKL